MVRSAEGGMRTFTRNLIAGLTRLEPSPNLVLYGSPHIGNHYTRCPDVETVLFNINPSSLITRSLLQHSLLPAYTALDSLDVLLSPGNVRPLACPVATIPILHSPLILPSLRSRLDREVTSPLHRLYYSITIPHSITHADKAVTVSHFFRDQLARDYDVDPSRFTVIEEGVDRDKFQAGLPQWRPTDRPFIFFLSNLYPYKNADKLLEAFSRLINETSLPHDLIIAGSDFKDEMARLQEKSRTLGSSSRVRFLGAVSDHLVSLYQGADLFVFPSSVETFGLPLLEAMACGTPVIASNRMSVPEIAGDAAVIVDPDDIAGLANAMEATLTNDDRQRSLVESGFDRVRQFSWEATARKYMRLITSLLR